MKSMQVFEYNGQDVRTAERNGETWWVLRDVCEVLGIKNVTDVAKRLDEDERARFNLGRQGETNIINESGLYNVILRSSKPEARAFKRWVTHEVLPQIRRTGGYGDGRELETVIAQTVAATVRAVLAEVRPAWQTAPHAGGMQPCITITPQLKLEQFPPDMRARVDAAMERMRAQKALNFSEIARFCTASGYGISSVAVKRYYDKYFG